MTSTIITPKRQFKMGSILLDDPAPDERPEDALQYYAVNYPHLAQAKLADPSPSADGQTLVFEVIKPTVNTKG